MLDKTGTLTLGMPVLTDLHVLDGFDHDNVLTLVAAAEAKSEHPVGQAIVKAAKDEGLPVQSVDDFSSVTGFGIAATVNGRRVHVGADRFMA